jgi:toxin ParE1/3/4
MARFRIARPAQADLTNILTASAHRRGAEGRRRYAAAPVRAMREVASHPEGPLTRPRAELARGLRSFHIRHAPVNGPASKVMQPVHVLYYRIAPQGIIEIVRVLHERMEPSRHLVADETTRRS